MKITAIVLWLFCAIFQSLVVHADDKAAAEAKRVRAPVLVALDGELRKWHKVTLTFDGPQVSETDSYNPFIHYRLNVEFEHVRSGKTYLVPGYFAADGDAANSSASSGNKWRVHFSADEIGDWQWRASFRKGKFVAVSSLHRTGYSGDFMDGQSGKFTIKTSNKKGPDFRSQGRLQYVNKPYLRFADSGKYFIKSGPDAPENLLAYADFDGTFHNDGQKDDLVKTWAPHAKDWKRGNPTWKKNKGKNLIGALNYIASKGMNSISFLTLNIMGDDKNVFPYIDYNTYDRMDVSKLDQWEIIFSHAQALGLFLHFKTQEVENQGLLDNGGLGLHRQLYYRELIARFGHHLALNWNMGEESGEWIPRNVTMPQNTIQRLAMAKYFYRNDPYNHHIVIHNGVQHDDLLGPESYYTGASLQTHHKDFSTVHPNVKRLRALRTLNGRPLAVAVDEPGDAQHSLLPDAEDPEHNVPRMNALWGALTGGAWGTEWYFGYKHAHSDLTAQDWRSRDLFWDQAKHALDFFGMIGVDYHKGQNHDELASNGAWVLAEQGEFYIVYLKNAEKEVKLKMIMELAKYSVAWFDPRNGGRLQDGTVKQIEVTEDQKDYWDRTGKSIGMPPKDVGKDWVALIKKI